MFTALDKNNNLINIEDTKVGEDYFCKHCKEKVFAKAKNSDKKAPHFCHNKSSNCVEQWAQHDMSEWHKTWQNYFPLECQERIVTNNSIKHIADILVNEFVIEFQHSPISLKNFSDRNQFYTSLGYKVVWVFDATDKVGWNAAEQCFYWKNVQNQFENSKNQNIDIFLEIKNNQGVPLLFLPREITPNKIFIYPSTNFWGNCFSRESFLKDYGVQVSAGILSIYEYFSIYQKRLYEAQQQRSQVVIPVYLPHSSGLRGAPIDYVFANNSYRKKKTTYRTNGRGGFRKR